VKIGVIGNYALLKLWTFHFQNSKTSIKKEQKKWKRKFVVSITKEKHFPNLDLT